MKKYIIFIVSFILIFSIAQVLSGLFLTATYTPHVSEVWSSSVNLPKEVTFGRSAFISTFVMAVFSVTIAYFVPKTLKRFLKN
ncbi:hypothetical protein [Heyndrickxia camelliae]|uniref:Uncharacterized protein n=1 Tax=Heyndrickxia camelliae TaxID=1707093 RepID=A0A2N3LDI4_9BACI|nr:hypothetical protein [Heyndrickxia camelliae]PKR82635.1 hypothetical protein CWO92_23290 [Heyndrickxia camelliae]